MEQVWRVSPDAVSRPQEACKMGSQPCPITVSNIGQLLLSDLLALAVHFRDLLVIIMDLTHSEAQSPR